METTTNEEEKMKARCKALIDRVGVAGNHLGLCLDVNHPPHTASWEEGRKHYGAGRNYEIWVAWKICYEVYVEGKRVSAAQWARCS